MKRVYVEKRESFNLEAKALLAEIRDVLGVRGLTGVRVLNVYDVEGVSDAVFNTAVGALFSESGLDDVFPGDMAFPAGARVLATASLPGQYDQRADFSRQCLNLMAPDADIKVRCGKCVILSGNVSDTEFEAIQKYYVNPVETVTVPLAPPETLRQDIADDDCVETVSGFAGLDDAGLLAARARYGLGMELCDLQFCQEYYQKEQKDPTVTELKILDTYWSDHCRHSTFMTVLDAISVEDGPFKETILEALSRYYAARAQTNGEAKPVCLMDLATMSMKKAKWDGRLNDMEQSSEVNACSILVDCVVDGKPEEWVFMFKNETHNHPTEIEPFGGASTCLGGGIRDPLSGRAYVYGAIRLTGSGDPRAPISETRAGKLPQRKITQTAAAGYSGYANQIGLASGHLAEIMDPGFVAKRMECGALVAAAKKEDVLRGEPVPGDVICLIGGDTGRDGCGGATGSSKEHDESSLATGGAEVQKGNPAIERNIVRLFRDENVSRLIKKCNDFGAGGVSVAVCELADSLEIDLDAVPLKYGGMNPTEIAISESQERMACLIAKADYERFAAACAAENTTCAVVADVTDTGRVRMRYKETVVADLSRAMLDSGGVRRHMTATIKSPVQNFSLTAAAVSAEKSLAENWMNNLKDLNVCSKTGIADRFSFTDGGHAVLAPFGGKRRKTPEEGLCMTLPAKKGVCETASVMTFGYDPKLGYMSPFHQGMYAVCQSVAKAAAMGADPGKIRLSFQEYYEKLGEDPAKWGKPLAALLGAFTAGDRLNAPSIGGKDSMSGTFADIHVPPSLISFAVSVFDVKRVVSRAFKKVGSCVVYVKTPVLADQTPDFAAFSKNLQMLHALIQQGGALAVSTVGAGGVAAAVSQMCLGNGVGFKFTQAPDDLFAPLYCDFIVELAGDACSSGFASLGETIEEECVIIGKDTLPLADIEAAWESALDGVFPRKPVVSAQDADAPNADSASSRLKPAGLAGKTVFIPIFPGTNGEYALEALFRGKGGVVSTFVMKNKTAADIRESYAQIAKNIDCADVLAIPSGYSAGGEPDGCGKLIALVLENETVKASVEGLLKRGGLIYGAGEGMKALVKTGLLPGGKYGAPEIQITQNVMGRPVCAVTNVRATASTLFFDEKPGDVKRLPVSTPEGRIVMTREIFDKLSQNGQIAAQYAGDDGNATMDPAFNPWGADFAVEALQSPDGRVFGRMAAPECAGPYSFINVRTCVQ